QAETGAGDVARRRERGEGGRRLHHHPPCGTPACKRHPTVWRIRLVRHEIPSPRRRPVGRPPPPLSKPRRARRGGSPPPPWYRTYGAIDPFRQVVEPALRRVGYVSATGRQSRSLAECRWRPHSGLLCNGVLIRPPGDSPDGVRQQDPAVRRGGQLRERIPSSAIRRPECDD